MGIDEGQRKLLFHRSQSVVLLKPNFDLLVGEFRGFPALLPPQQVAVLPLQLQFCRSLSEFVEVLRLRAYFDVLVLLQVLQPGLLFLPFELQRQLRQLLYASLRWRRHWCFGWHRHLYAASTFSLIRRMRVLRQPIEQCSWRKSCSRLWLLSFLHFLFYQRRSHKLRTAIWIDVVGSCW